MTIAKTARISVNCIYSHSIYKKRRGLTLLLLIKFCNLYFYTYINLLGCIFGINQAKDLPKIEKKKRKLAKKIHFV